MANWADRGRDAVLLVGNLKWRRFVWGLGSEVVWCDVGPKPLCRVGVVVKSRAEVHQSRQGSGWCCWWGTSSGGGLCQASAQRSSGATLSLSLCGGLGRDGV